MLLPVCVVMATASAPERWMRGQWGGLMSDPTPDCRWSACERPCCPSRVPDMEEQGRVNGLRLSAGQRGSDWGRITLLDKTKEFFRTCDVEGKGFITRTDMRVRRRKLCVCVVKMCVLDLSGAEWLLLKVQSVNYLSCELERYWWRDFKAATWDYFLKE